MIWECTCRWCPEQYDIYLNSYGVYNDIPVAYFRIRHGNLFVYPYKHGEIDWHTEIYYKHYNDERGGFDQSNPIEKQEFRKVFRIINFKIHLYLIKQWFKNLFV